jgi:hypothetical protein
MSPAGPARVTSRWKEKSFQRPGTDEIVTATQPLFSSYPQNWSSLTGTGGALAGWLPLQDRRNCQRTAAIASCATRMMHSSRIEAWQKRRPRRFVTSCTQLGGAGGRGIDGRAGHLERPARAIAPAASNQIAGDRPGSCAESHCTELSHAGLAIAYTHANVLPHAPQTRCCACSASLRKHCRTRSSTAGPQKWRFAHTHVPSRGRNASGRISPSARPAIRSERSASPGSRRVKQLKRTATGLQPRQKNH